MGRGLMKAVFDSNILIDYLNGIPESKDELSLYSDKHISIISWIEVMAGVSGSNKEEKTVRKFLDSFTLRNVTLAIAEKSVTIRKQNRIRLPDSIIWATAQTENLLLVTRNTRDFPEDNPGIRVPYVI